jgi:hypothetical protein
MLMLQHLLSTDVAGMVGVVYRPLSTLPSELYRWIKQDTMYEASQTEEYIMHIDYAKSMMNAMEVVERGKQLPCMLSDAANFIVNMFDCSEEQVNQIHDAAYLFSMMNVMAGVSTIEDVVVSLEPMFSTKH